MAARTLFGAEIASTTGKAKETQCHKCGNVFMADSLFCRHCGSKREEVPVQQSALQISSPIHMLTEEEQGQILVERKIEAFRQLAANLDAQVIDQIVDEHNRRLVGSTGVGNGAALEACQQELAQCKELLALKEQELADCREELQRLREYSTALEERDQKLSAAVHSSAPMLDQVHRKVSFTPSAVQPTIAAINPAASRFAQMDTNHDGLISQDEFESHRAARSNVYMADTNRGHPTAASVGSSSPGGRCMVQLPSQATYKAAYLPSHQAPVMPMPIQDSLFQRIDSNHDGVISAEEAISHCPNCGNLYMADSIFCRHCGRRRD